MKRSSKPRYPPEGSGDEGKSLLAAKIRILIADDHTTVLAGLASIIGMQPDMLVVAEAANGREAVDLWRKQRPDVTLLDLRMPMLDGVGVIDEIRKEDTSARIIMLTTYDTDNEIYRAIKAGAKGYLLKDARREELLDCIRKLNRGETCIPAGPGGKAGGRHEQRNPDRPGTWRVDLAGARQKQQGNRRESLHQRDHGERAFAQYLHEAECSQPHGSDHSRKPPRTCPALAVFGSGAV